jgi:hypothetical protein
VLNLALCKESGAPIVDAKGPTIAAPTIAATAVAATTAVAVAAAVAVAVVVASREEEDR